MADTKYIENTPLIKQLRQATFRFRLFNIMSKSLFYQRLNKVMAISISIISHRDDRHYWLPKNPMQSACFHPVTTHAPAGKQAVSAIRYALLVDDRPLARYRG